jgi:hypothetical protein
MAVAKKIGARGYAECSSKTSEGLQELFQTAARDIHGVGLYRLEYIPEPPREKGRQRSGWQMREHQAALVCGDGPDPET